MKKLLCLALLATMIVGCSSKEKEEDKVGTKSNLITQMLANVDSNKKAEEKDTTSTTDGEKEDGGANDEGTEAKTDDTTKPNDNNSNQTSGGSSSGGSKISCHLLKSTLKKRTTIWEHIRWRIVENCTQYI